MCLINECDFKDFDLQIFSDHEISNHANSNILFSSGDSNGYSRNYLEDQALLEKEEHFDDIKVAEADQGCINRYNLIDRPRGSCNFGEISTGGLHFVRFHLVQSPVFTI